MQQKFLQIKQAYKELHDSFLKKGSIPQRETSSGYWAASDPEAILKLFKHIGLDKYSSFVDLGSGDGLVTALASLFTKSTGIESDPSLITSSNKIKNQLALNCNFIPGDFLNHDLSQFQLLFIYPDNHFHFLEPKISLQKTIIVDNLYKPLYMKPKKTIDFNGVKFNLFL